MGWPGLDEAERRKPRTVQSGILQSSGVSLRSNPGHPFPSPTSCGSTRQNLCGGIGSRHRRRCKARSRNCGCAARRRWAAISIAARSAIINTRSSTRAVIDTARSAPELNEPTGLNPRRSCCCPVLTIIRSCSRCPPNCRQWLWGIAA